MTVGLTIYSDGTPKGTKIVTEDGETLDNVVEFSLRVAVGEDFADATLTLRMPIFSGTIRNPTIVFLCPLCDENETHVCTTAKDKKNMKIGYKVSKKGDVV